jgi:hypothetical protein
MKNDLIKLAVAGVFAIIATVLNVVWVKQQLPQKDNYVSYTVDLPHGTEIKPNHLQPVALPGKKGEYSQLLVSWENCGMLYGQTLTRNVNAGEAVLHSDISPVILPPESDVLGPFRILSIGGVLASGEDARSGGSHSFTISIISKNNLKQEIELLKQIVNNKEQLSVVAYPILPDDEKDTIVHNDEFVVFINLPDLPMVEQVLKEKTNLNKVGFLVPKIYVESLKKLSKK